MLILLRHGRTEANRAGLLQGRVDNPLDDHGRQQASDAAAHILASTGTIHRVIASPLVRAQQTAAALGLPVETDERMIELNYGEWEEKPVGAVPAETWAEWRANLDFRPPGGETLSELGTRVRRAMADIAETAADQNVVVVSHVSPMKSALAWALGQDDQVTWSMYIQQASICRIAFRGGHPVVASMNEVAAD